MAATDDNRRTAFGAALNARRRQLGLSQRTIAERVNDHTGTNYADASVGQWEKGEHIPEPDIVFALERALELAGGDLSHCLGYVPVGSTSVLAAIDSDPSLSDIARKLLRALALEASSEASS